MLGGSPQSSPSLLLLLCSAIPAALLLQVVSSASLSYFAVSRSPSSFVFPLSSPFPSASLSSYGFMLFNPPKQAVFSAYIHLQDLHPPQLCSRFVS